MSLSNIKSSIRVTAILGAIEFLIILALGIFALAKTDTVIHPEYFNPANSADGMGGLLFAFIFGFLVFVGFESGLPLTEETANTKSATFKGLMISVFVMGLFFTFMSYATVVAFGGAEDTVGFAKTFSTTPDPYSLVLGVKAFGAIGPWMVFFAILNSTVACCLSSNTATTRVFFSLGRVGILPRALGHVCPTTKVPRNAVLFAGALTFVIGFIAYLIIPAGKNMEWYGFFGVMLMLPLLLIHLVTCISVFVAYRYKESHDFHFVHHGIIPFVTGVLVLLPIWGGVYYNQVAPMSYAPYVVAVWFVIGIIVYARLKKSRPQTLLSLENEMEMLNHPPQDTK